MDKFISLKQFLGLVAVIFAAAVSWALWGKTMWEFPEVWAQEKQAVERKITNVQAEQAKYAAEEHAQEQAQTQTIRDMMALNLWERCWAMHEDEPRCAQQQDSIRAAWVTQDSIANVRLQRQYMEIEAAVARDTT